jgi:hypothetical protein
MVKAVVKVSYHIDSNTIENLLVNCTIRSGVLNNESFWCHCFTMSFVHRKGSLFEGLDGQRTSATLSNSSSLHSPFLSSTADDELYLRFKGPKRQQFHQEQLVGIALCSAHLSLISSAEVRGCCRPSVLSLIFVCDDHYSLGASLGRCFVVHDIFKVITSFTSDMPFVLLCFRLLKLSQLGALKPI